MVFCNSINSFICQCLTTVTILILIDGFLQYVLLKCLNNIFKCHNPYFNRWFSAILSRGRWILMQGVTILILIDGFLQSVENYDLFLTEEGHNPYFNRWFSAIAAKISQNFTFLCKKLVFSDSFCELYFTQPLYINYCTNYLNIFLLKLAKIKAIINII